MKKPHSLSGKTKLSLQRWPDYTNDEHILLNTDRLFTVCEPSPEVRAAYLKKIGMTEEDLRPKEQPKVLLNEDEQLPTGYDDYYDDEEPNYREV